MSDDKKDSKDIDELIGFPKKWKKHLPAGFEETAGSLTTEELKAKLVEYQKEIVQAEDDMDGDVKLNDAKEQVKELSEPYKTTMSSFMAMTKYALYVMKGRGH